jgi:hypothetical protein
MSQRRKTALAFAIGASISAVGYFLVINESTEVPAIIQVVGIIFGVLFIPGLLVGLLVNSNMHDPNLFAAVIANALLYGFILRLIFKRWRKGSPRHGTEE